MTEPMRFFTVSSFLVSLIPLFKSSKLFYDCWAESGHEHWQTCGCPPFAVFYLAMPLLLPLIYGNALSHLKNATLLKRRADLRYSFAISQLLLALAVIWSLYLSC